MKNANSVRMDKEKELKNLFLNDPYELLVNKVSSSGAITADERLTSSFLEINQFYKKNRREPEPNIKDISEHQLYLRLKGLRSDNKKMLALKDEDEFGLLDVEMKSVSTLDDIYSDDSLGILDSDPEDIFKLKHVLNLKITMHCVLCEKIIKGDVFCGYDRSFCTEKHRNMFINSNQELLKEYPDAYPYAYAYNIKNLLTIKIKTQPKTVNCEKLTNPTESE